MEKERRLEEKRGWPGAMRFLWWDTPLPQRHGSEGMQGRAFGKGTCSEQRGGWALA